MLSAKFFETADKETAKLANLLNEIAKIESVICNPTARKEYSAEELTNLKLKYAELVRQANKYGLMRNTESRAVGNKSQG